MYILKYSEINIEVMKLKTDMPGISLYFLEEIFIRLDIENAFRVITLGLLDGRSVTKSGQKKSTMSGNPDLLSLGWPRSHSIATGPPSERFTAAAN